MFDKLEDVEKKYEVLCHQLQNPSVAADQVKFQKLMKEQAELEKVVSLYRRYKKIKQTIEETKQMLSDEKDEELRELAKEELLGAESSMGEIKQALKIALIPKDPKDDKNIILEIRAGAGGDEASLFAEELFMAYTHYTGGLGFKTEEALLFSRQCGGS